MTATVVLLGSAAVACRADDPEPCKRCRAGGTLVYGGGVDGTFGGYGSLGLVLGDVRHVGRVTSMRFFGGVLIQGDLGEQALGVSVSPMVFPLKFPAHWWSPPIAGAALKLSYLRTRRDGQEADDEDRLADRAGRHRGRRREGGQSYLGLTAECQVVAHVRVGYLWHLGSASRGRSRWVWSWGFGF